MKNKKKDLIFEYLIKGVEVLSGIIVGVVIWKVSDDSSTISALMSIIVGLLTSLIIIMFTESFKQQKDIGVVRNTYEELIRIISDGKNNSEEKLAYILKYGVVNFAERHMPVVWRELLWGVNKTYYATNYIKSDEIYDQGWSEAALAIQKAKVFGENVDIKKVFVIDDNAELETIKLTIQNQTNCGVNARYIFKHTIDKSITLSHNLKKLSSVDFGVFDNHSVFVWKLKNRSFVGGEVKFKSEEIKMYKEFFNQLFLEASVINTNHQELIMS